MYFNHYGFIAGALLTLFLEKAAASYSIGVLITSVFVCEKPGKFPHAKNETIYHQCTKRENGKLTHKVIPCEVPTCFNATIAECHLEACSGYVPPTTTTTTTTTLAPPIVHECSPSRIFDCTGLTPGSVHADPEDPTVYYKCVLNENNLLTAVCFPCSSETCFSNIYKECIPMKDPNIPCDQIILPNKTIPRPYNCEIYDGYDFNCDIFGHNVQGSIPTVFKVAIPGDKSAYFQCTLINEGPPKEWVAECKQCPKETKSCFIDKFKRCVENCGVGPHYSCVGKEFNCMRPGIFAHPKDQTVYIQCININGKLEAFCYACNPKHHECFKEDVKSCVINTNGGNCKNSTGITDLLLHNCDGLSNNSFPCAKLLNSGQRGPWPYPGDKSIYFDCKIDPNDGSIHAICYACPKETNSCYIPEKKRCVESCGLGPDPKPYNCSLYNNPDLNQNPDFINKFKCKEEGLFQNEKDPSIYFQCNPFIDDQGNIRWELLCFSCNGGQHMCFNQELQHCVKPPAGKNCSNLNNQTEPSLSHSCKGYSNLSFPCGVLGTTSKWLVVPGDPSVYFRCVKTVRGRHMSNGFHAECKSCPKETKSCFIEKEQRCRENCGSEIPYSCDSPQHQDFQCYKEGIFPGMDGTVYFKCIKVNGVFVKLCYSCNSEEKKCFNQQSYNCDGYGRDDAFPCKKLLELGKTGPFPMPGDKSVYFDCITDEDTGAIKAVCHTCPKATNSCFIPEQKKCIENCGIPKPYNCSLYTNTNNDPSQPPYRCTKPGLFANPLEPSIYFQCIRNGDHWEVRCFTCNKDLHTCFNEELQRCVKPAENSGGSCVGKNVTIPNPHNETGLSHSCKGYTNFSFPCGSHENYTKHWHTMLGDPSIYFKCVKKEEKFYAVCKACPKETKSCFIEKEQRCRENCGQEVPYSCESPENEAFKCPREGIFPGKDGTVYFKCVRVNGKFEKFCYACSSKEKLCFSQHVQTCVSCTNTTINETGTLTYSCKGYRDDAFPCEKLLELGKIGPFPMPGDKSIYFDCIRDEVDDKIKPVCQTCAKATNSCFIPEQKKCVENCGMPYPYNCSFYQDPSIYTFHCTKPGLFANPKDPSIYFQCIKKGDHWQVLCFTCNQDLQTCFNEDLQRCVEPIDPTGGSCYGKNLTNPDPHNNETDLSHTCKGYTNFSFPCGNHRVYDYTKEWHAMAGDPSVYFKCVQHPHNPKEYIAICKSCPKETKSCFDEKQQKCVERCGQGPAINGTVKPYDCSGYDELSYPCKESGTFHPHPKDPTIFFHCVVEDGRLVSKCYACNILNQACYNETLNKCVPNCNQNGTGPGPGHESNCKGYGIHSVPCAQLGPQSSDNRVLYAHLGDPTVYFRCVLENDVWKAFCHRCPLKTCFNQEKQMCLADHCEGKNSTDPGENQKYDCTIYKYDSYPCREIDEGTVHPNPVDTSVYFQCRKIKGKIKAVCYTCNSVKNTCFVSDSCHYIKNDECGTITSTISNGAALPYDCTGYRPKRSIPCKQLGMPGIYPFPGDKSAYFECHKNMQGILKGECKTCSEKTQQCFMENNKICVDYCGGDPPAKPYDCKSVSANKFECEEEGLFPGEDATIYFRCVTRKGRLQKLCYTCTSKPHSCFNQNINMCVANPNGDQRDCKNATGNFTGILTHSCDGYTPESFPCSSLSQLYIKGPHPMPADQSVYFHCHMTGNGRPDPVCVACPKKTNSCYSIEKKKCVPNCGLGIVPKPYNCSDYNQLPFKCKEEGIFVNPNDSSIYFQCIKNSSKPGRKWQILCFACDSSQHTCFNEELQSCVKPADGKNCTATIITPVNNQTTPSLSYSCKGYSNHSFPCKELGASGDKLWHAMPGDKSVYFRCIKIDNIKNGYKAECKACSKATNSCFIEEKQMCVEECGNPTHKPYMCEAHTYENFVCPSEGIFPGNHSTTYFHCIMLTNGTLQALCYTCNKQMGTCFSPTLQTCVIDDTGNQCRNNGTDGKEILTHNCKGYDQFSFPCKRLLAAGRVGPWPMPGDKSIYFDCKKEPNGNIRAICHACPKETKSCYNPEKKKCIENCLLGPDPIPYNCSVYSNNDYQNKFICTKEGLFVNPKDSSIYFQCIKKGNDWLVLCFTCSASDHTCFNEQSQTCVKPLNGKHCKDQGNGNVTNNQTSLSHSCKGFTNFSFPCGQLGPIYGSTKWHAMPGDKSVYFRCIKNANHKPGYKAECKSCPKNTNSCFIEEKQKCIGNCGLVEPYHCNGHSYEDFKCEREGLFPGKDFTTYLQCIKVNGTFETLCYSCAENNTCFNPNIQRCVLNPSGNDCNNQTGGGSNATGSLSHSCAGYNPDSFPCAKLIALGKKGPWPLPADKSVYFECIRNKNGSITPKCHTCPKETNSCYIYQQKKCVENCGKGPDPKPYNCSDYDQNKFDKGFKCKKEGIFANPLDSSVYFKCVKVGDKLVALCYTCSKTNNQQTCFNEQVQACVNNEDGNDCKGKNITEPVQNSTAITSLTHSCKGYTQYSFPCEKLSLINDSETWYVMEGDKSVYFRCIKEESGNNFKAECKACPKETNSCFIPEKQRCVDNCGKGPDHKPYECSSYNSPDTNQFPCEEEGLFVNPLDSSIYFKCVAVEDDWEVFCFTCNPEIPTCFNQDLQVCIKMDYEDETCPKGNETIPVEPGFNNQTSLSYSCEGYKDSSFPCEQIGSSNSDIFQNPEIWHALPGDPSVYFRCVKDESTDNLYKPECKACPKSTKSCFIDELQKCVENCGEGPKPYECDAVAYELFKCPREGIFPGKDFTIYFRCVKVNGVLHALCYSCNSKNKTCYSQAAHACVQGGCKNETGGNNETGLTHSCDGYSSSSFPCEKLVELGRTGPWPLPGDKSVYFECIEHSNGSIYPVCHTCPKETKSCFDFHKKECIENCGKPEPLSYHCSFFNNNNESIKHFECKAEGLFAYPKDASIYFKCTKKGDEWERLCFACSQTPNQNTCFNETFQSCVTVIDGEDCKGGNFTGKNSTLFTRSCEGYTHHSFPCTSLGNNPDKWIMLPGDKAVYFRCYNNESDGGRLTVECKSCPKETNACYIESKQKCVENCGLGTGYKPSVCSFNPQPDGQFYCVWQSLILFLGDYMVYLTCYQAREDGKFESFCFACKQRNPDCFNENMKTCEEYETATFCGRSIETGSGFSGRFNNKAAFSYSCEGYTNNTFPCKRTTSPIRTMFKNPRTWYGLPEDPSVYFRCVKDEEDPEVYKSECKPCPKASKSCFIEEKQKCVDYCGEGVSVKPYQCDENSYETFECPASGLFPGHDFTIYYLCVSVNGKLEALCYTCDSERKTCFNQATHSCVANINGNDCNNLMSVDGKNATAVLSHSCAGYGGNSFPCEKLIGLGKTGPRPLPGDRSVYFDCLQQPDGSVKTVCRSCPKETNSCFDVHKKKCIENCGKPIKPHNCNIHTCNNEGLFVNPKDTLAYFKCARVGSSWNVFCYTCNKQIHTCFSEPQQSCITSTSEGENATCLMDSDTDAITTLSYSCAGYDNSSFPCQTIGEIEKAIKFPQWHVLPGDPSVYFQCVESSNSGIFQAICKNCPSETISCFVEEKQKCNDNCGKTPDPYDCSLYTSESYPCGEEGLFPNAGDPTVFFHCKLVKGELEAYCYSCNKKQKSCFDLKRKICVPNCGKENSTEVILPSPNCDGYGKYAVPCEKMRDDFGASQELYLPHPGDTSVYFRCISVDGNHKQLVSYCHKCPNNACFLPQKQLCVFSGCTIYIRGKCVEQSCSPHKAYDCGRYNINSYPCESEGLFVLKENPTVFFDCKFDANLDKWMSLCYECSSADLSCFDVGEERCVERCGHVNKEHVPHYTTVKELSYCKGYRDHSVPCSELAKSRLREGKHWELYVAHLGDASVYFRCVPFRSEIVTLCHKCPKKTCYDDKLRLCVDNDESSC